MNKPKIAVLIDWYLPGTKAGGPVRSVFSLVSMMKADYDFYIITTNTDLGSSQPYEGLQADTLFERDQVHYYYFSRPALNAKRIAGLLAQIKPQLVYLNSFWSYHFSIGIVHLKNAGLIEAPLLLAPRGMLGKGAMQLKSFKKQTFLRLATFLKFYRHVHFHATQQQELADIRARFRNAMVSVAPNVNSSLPLENLSPKTPGSLRLFFLSRISRVKNVLFGLRLLAKIPATCTIEYSIYGNIEDAEYWEACKKTIESLPPHIRVTYKGELLFHQVQSAVSKHHALLMPTLNENYGHSIVESLLCGCPVIISDQTPWNDVSVHNAGYAIDLADEAGFIRAIVEITGLDQQGFLAKSRAATTYIAEKTKPASIINQYKILLNERIKN